MELQINFNFLVYKYALNLQQDYYLIDTELQYFDQFVKDRNILLIDQPFMIINVKDNSSLLIEVEIME